MIQDDGGWKRQIASLRSNVSKRIHDMRRAGMHRDGLDPSYARKLLTTEVFPVVEYASAVWLLTQAEMEKVQVIINRAIRTALGLPRFASLEPLLGDLDMVECMLKHRWRWYRVNMWHKVKSMDSSRWIHRAVQLWRKSALAGPDTIIRNWLSRVSDDLTIHLGILPRFGHDDAVSYCRDIPHAVWHRVTTEASYDAAVKEWCNDIAASPHLQDHYAVFLQHMVLEPRVKMQPARMASFLYFERNKRKRQFYSMLRANSLPVQCFEKGKRNMEFWRCGSNSGSPHCFMCNTGALETLQHFAFECPAYADLRAASPLRFDVDMESIFSTMVTRVNHVGKEFTAPQLDVYVDVWYNQWCRRIWRWRRSDPDHGNYMFLGGERRHYTLDDG